MSAVQVPQSTSRVVMLKVFLTGTTTAATGKTVAITISKAGGAFANPNAGVTNATEVASGWYKVTLGASDWDTLGDLAVRGTASACDDAERLFAVVKATNAGLTGVPDAVAEASGGLPTLSAAQASGGTVNANLRKIGTATAVAATSGGTVEFNDTVAYVNAPMSLVNDAITAAKIAAGALNGTGDWGTATALASVRADTDNIQTRLPAALVGGKIDASATISGTPDVNVSQVNGVDVGGSGTTLDPWGPQSP